MPDGLVAWIDRSAGEAGITRDGRAYVARLLDVEPRARHVGARVRFDVRRAEGVEKAVDVQLRGGMRSARHHRQVGTLVGAHDPEARGAAPYAERHATRPQDLQLHPLQVVSAWARQLASGDANEALALCDRDLALHLDGVTLRSHRHIRPRLESLPVFAAGRIPRVRGEDGAVVARWDPPGPGEAAVEVRCHVRHGRITEQWIGPPGPESTTSALETAAGPATLTTATRGEVPADAVEYAVRRIRQVTDRVEEPILFARVTLSLAPDPARARPAIAQVSLNLNGQFVGAHVAAGEMHEAADLLSRRLADQLEHRAERLQALRRRPPGQPGPGEWRHGGEPASRPEYFDRPPEERQLVRHKAFVAAAQPLDEALFDMEQMDYDFYLFRDLGAGEDGLLERLADGTYRLQHLHPVEAEPVAGTGEVQAERTPAPTLTLEEAVGALSAAGSRFLFFADALSGRGSVVYRRYDGHYGLITLA